MISNCRRVLLLFSAVILTLTACGKDSGVVAPGDELGAEHWWDNYIDSTGTPITLSSGFRLVPLSAVQQTAKPTTTNAVGIVLSFVIEPRYSTNRGYLFRGNDQGTNSEDLAGAVEFIKDSGWLSHRETFDWEGERRSGSSATRINRFTQFPIRSPFNGVATDLMLTLLARPYVAFPTDTTKHWFGPPVHVSNGSGGEILEIISYGIEYLGSKSLVENKTTKLGTFEDVIHIYGRANAGEAVVDAYLVPNIGIIYYHLVTAFGQKAAGALIGYAGANYDLDGNPLKDYFPMNGGNNWIYEFAPDNSVDDFRFTIE